MCVANDVPVNLECGTCVGMPELTLSDFRRSPGVEQESGVTMTERVESASGNPERIEKCPQMIFHDFVR
jgi:hypothetical protein